MNYKKFRLKNGLRVVVIPMPSLASVTTAVWVKVGSRQETSKINGISHFLEHMAFKGSQKRPTAHEISSAVDALGGEFNAATSKDWTNFYIKARGANLETAFDVLSDMVLSPLLKEEEIEREKGVIVEELAMYEDTPIIKIGDVFERLAFDGNSLSWDVGGSPKTVRRIKRDDFISYRKQYYYPENMLLTIAGGVKVDEARKLAEKYFGGLISAKKESAVKEFKSKQKGPRVKLHSKKVEQSHFILGFQGHGRGYKGRFIENVLSAILGGGMSSRLFIEVRERRGLAYSVKTSIERYGTDAGYIGTYAGVDPKKAEEAIKVILDQITGLASGRYPITPKELSKAKEFIKGHLALALEDTRVVNEFFGLNELFLGKLETPGEIFKAIDGVKVEKILAEAKKTFVPAKLSLGIIGSYRDESMFAKLLR